MTQYSAPTKVPLATRLSASGFFTPVGTLPPVWQTLPSQFQQTQGTSINFASLCSDPQSFTLVFSISANSAVSAATLAAGGIALASNGLMTIASNATLQTLNGVIVNADNQHGKNTDSGAFSIAVIAATLAWTVYRNYTLVNSSLVAGSNPQILGPFGSYIAARNVAIDNAATPDIIAVLPGNYPNDDIGIRGNIIIACLGAQKSSTGWNTSTLATVNSIADTALTALSNKTAWIEGLRVFGKKNQNCGGAGGGTSCAGAVLGFLQNVTFNKCAFEECALGILGSGYVGNIVVQDTEFKNCGSCGSPNTHSIYVVGGSGASNQPINPNHSITVGPGCRFWFSDDWCSYQSGQEWRVGIGHYVKSDMIQTNVFANYFRTTTPGGGGSVTAAIQGDTGGNFDIRGNIIEEGLSSGVDPTSSNHPVGSSGFPKCPATAITYHVDNDRIIGMNPGQIQDGNGHDFAWAAQYVPGGVPYVKVLQNTIVNDGRSSENFVQLTYGGSHGAPDGFVTSAYYANEANVTRKDNYIMRGLGLADVDANPSWIADGSNTVVQTNSAFVNAPLEDYTPVTSVPGSQNWAQYEFVFPVGHKARTDATRGAVSVAGVPAWVRSLPLNQWYAIPGGTLTDNPVVNAYTDYPWERKAKWTFECSFAVVEETSEVISFGGGHPDQKGNDVIGFRLGQDTPSWRLLVAHTPSAQMNITLIGDSNYFDDGKPVPGNNHYKPFYWKKQKKWLLYGTGPIFVTGQSSGVFTIDPFASTSIWLPGPNQSHGTSVGADYTNGHFMDQIREKVFSLGTRGAMGSFFVFDLNTMTGSQFSGNAFGGTPDCPMQWWTGLHDEFRDRYITIGGIRLIIPPTNYLGRTHWNPTGPEAGLFNTVNTYMNGSFSHDTDRDVYIYRFNDPLVGAGEANDIDAYFEINPDTFAMQRMTPASDPVAGRPVAEENVNGNVFKKFQYVSALGGIIYGHTSNTPLKNRFWFVRTTIK